MTTTPTAPLTLDAAPGVESCIAALVHALQQEKGWLHGYADSIIRDAIDRVHLDAAPEQLKVVAYLVTGLSSGEPSICFEDERGDYGDEDHMPVFDALCSLTEAQSALSAQAATIAQLEEDARRLDWLVSQTDCTVQDGGAAGKWLCWIDPYDSTRSEYQKGEYPNARAAIDAAIAAHGKDGAHD